MSLKELLELCNRDVYDSMSDTSETAAARSTERDVLHAGDRVELHSLQAKPEYNGRSGTLVAFDDGSGRWQVDLVGGGSLIVKASNLINLTMDERRDATSSLAADQRFLAALNTFAPKFNALQADI